MSRDALAHQLKAIDNVENFTKCVVQCAFLAFSTVPNCPQFAQRSMIDRQRVNMSTVKSSHGQDGELGAWHNVWFQVCTQTSLLLQAPLTMLEDFFQLSDLDYGRYRKFRSFRQNGGKHIMTITTCNSILRILTLVPHDPPTLEDISSAIDFRKSVTDSSCKFYRALGHTGHF